VLSFAVGNWTKGKKVRHARVTVGASFLRMYMYEMPPGFGLRQSSAAFPKNRSWRRCPIYLRGL